MNDVAQLITRIQQGETAVYSTVIDRFQDMAVGYAYATLGDLGLAEDVAQEAFIAAYYTLAALREPAAFPGWFRQIVHTQINRVQRRKQPVLAPWAEAETLAAPELEPALVVERQLLRDEVTAAVAALPEAQREVITLFYMGDYSQREISNFLDLPVSTIKMRLHHARKRLKEQMMSTLQQQLSEQRPSRNQDFAQTIQAFLDATRSGNLAELKTLSSTDPTLVTSVSTVNHRLWVGETSPLHWAVMHQQREVIDFLLAQGADIHSTHNNMTALQNAIDLYLLPDLDYDEGMIDFLMARGATMDLFSALFLGKEDVVRELVEADPALVHTRGPGNLTPLCFAGKELAAFLVDHGADILADVSSDTHTSFYNIRNPIQAIARWPNLETVRYLLERAGIVIDAYLACLLDESEQVKSAVQANPTILRTPTPQGHVLNEGWTLLHLAVRYGRQGLVDFLLDQGADVNAMAPALEGMTPLHVAAWRNDVEMAQRLLDHGAQVNAQMDRGQMTPFALAKFAHGDGMERTEVAIFLRTQGAV